MKRSKQTIVFIVLLGLFASIILIGVNLLTEERIEANELAIFESAVLDGLGISYTTSTINTTFENDIVVHELDDRIVYEDPTSGRITFRFEGIGLWGPISGVLTLENDYTTIAHITVLHHEETPGLGGIVAERDYLDTFVGKQMRIDIVKDATSLTDSQVDSISGATRTSDAFELLLNQSYTETMAAWEAANE